MISRIGTWTTVWMGELFMELWGGTQVGDQAGVKLSMLNVRCLQDTSWWSPMRNSSR